MFVQYRYSEWVVPVSRRLVEQLPAAFSCLDWELHVYHNELITLLPNFFQGVIVISVEHLIKTVTRTLVNANAEQTSLEGTAKRIPFFFLIVYEFHVTATTNYQATVLFKQVFFSC